VEEKDNKFLKQLKIDRYNKMVRPLKKKPENIKKEWCAYNFQYQRNEIMLLFLSLH
jgi:hypothetical protein